MTALWMVSGDESERQVILLALAKLALERPGWDSMLGDIAERFQGRPMFDGFKRENVSPIASAIRTLRYVARQCGAGGHRSRERMLNALADMFEFESFGAGESGKKGEDQQTTIRTATPVPDTKT